MFTKQIPGVERGTEEEALRESMALYKKNFKAVSKEDFYGKYRKAFQSLHEKIMDLGTVVMNDTVFFMNTSCFDDSQKACLYKVFHDAEGDIKKAFSHMNYDELMAVFEKMKGKYIDVYLTLYSEVRSKEGL